jgi:hypothetical protein
MTAPEPRGAAMRELTYERGHRCDRCGCALYDGYPFTVCDDCWPHRREDTSQKKDPSWWVHRSKADTP